MNLEDLLDQLHGETECRQCRMRLKSDRLNRGPMNVRVGSKPGVRQYDDRWGRPVGQWYPASYGYITERRWEAVNDFQTPIKFDAKDIDPNATMEEHLASPAGLEVKRKMELNPNVSTVWEMNVADPFIRGEWIRMCAVFGEPHLVCWSWVDAWVKYPLYWLAAKFLSFIEYGAEVE